MVKGLEIFMDAEYYEFVIENRTMVDKVPAIPAFCLIPLKAKAFLNELPTGSSAWRDIREAVRNPELLGTEELISLIEVIFQLDRR